MPADPQPDDLPVDHDEVQDDEPIRLKAHTPVWPIAIAGAVAVLAVAVILIVRPDQAAAPLVGSGTDPSATTSATTGTPAPTGPVSPDPNVLWVDMPTDAQDQALLLLDVWAGLDPGAAASTDLPAGPSIESAGITPDGEVELFAVGREAGTGPCQNQQELSVVEGDEAVVVYVRSRDVQSEQSGLTAHCEDLGFQLTLPVPLAEPLGDRALLSLNRWVAQDGQSPRLPIAG